MVFILKEVLSKLKYFQDRVTGLGTLV